MIWATTRAEEENGQGARMSMEWVVTSVPLGIPSYQYVELRGVIECHLEGSLL